VFSLLLQNASNPGSTGLSTITSVVNGTQDVDSRASLSHQARWLSHRSSAILSRCGPRPCRLCLAPGVYTLTLTGTNSASMGSDAGNLALTLGFPRSARARNYAMLLAGLGIVAFLRAAAAPDRRRLDIEAGPACCSWARRRRHSPTSVFASSIACGAAPRVGQGSLLTTRRRLRPQPSSPTATIATKPGLDRRELHEAGRIGCRFASSRMS
jgi:hypothetical protein